MHPDRKDFTVNKASLNEAVLPSIEPNIGAVTFFLFETSVFTFKMNIAEELTA